MRLSAIDLPLRHRCEDVQERQLWCVSRDRAAAACKRVRAFEQDMPAETERGSNGGASAPPFASRRKGLIPPLTTGRRCGLQPEQTKRSWRRSELGQSRVREHRIDLAAPCLYQASGYISDTFLTSAPSAQPRQGGRARTTNGPSIHLPYARSVEDLSGQPEGLGQRPPVVLSRRQDRRARRQRLRQVDAAAHHGRASTTSIPARPGPPRAPGSAIWRRSRSSIRRNRCAKTSWRAWRRRRRCSTATTNWR